MKPRAPSPGNASLQTKPEGAAARFARREDLATLPPGDTAANRGAEAAPPLDELADLPRVDRALYVVGAEVARGGMGRILAARDRRAGRPVALKELLTLDQDARARFEREARITARLQHPAIVPIYEVGRWDDGEPFYAMKHVDGRSLDKVIAGTKTLAERLALVPNVLAVADALAYAHSRGIIHRDLKPANILIGAFGETVVIDWGIAKDLAAEPAADGGGAGERPSDQALTLAGETMGTPAYMPPEQVSAESVDERADVYALGATLYHLLGGDMPYADATSADEVMAKLTAGPPARLDTLEPDVPPDLLAVVGKAMARDPAARYATAKELCHDLRRFQTGQLVGVHRYTTWQLIRRWVRRHRTAVAVAAAAAVVVLVVVVLSVTSIVHAQRRAEHQSVVASQSRADAEELMDFMLGDLRKKLEPIGKLELLEAVARTASTYYEQRPEALGPDDQRKRAQAQQNLGDVLVALGNNGAALAAYRASQAIRATLVASDPSNTDWQHDRALGHSALGKALWAQGDLPAALTEFRASQAIGELLVAADPTKTGWQRDLSYSHDHLGAVLQVQGDLPAALDAYRAALATRVKLATSDLTNTTWQSDLSSSHSYLGGVLKAQGDLPAAVAAYSAALAIRENLAAADPANADWQRALAYSHADLGAVLSAQGLLSAALVAHRSAIAIREKLTVSDPTNTEWQSELSVSQRYLGAVLEVQGNLPAALAAYRAALAIGENLVSTNPANAGWQRSLVTSQDMVGYVLMMQGDDDAALALHRASLSIRAKLAAADPTNTEAQRELEDSHIHVGDVLMKQGSLPAALTEYGAALAICEKLAAADATNTQWQYDLSINRSNVGDVHLAQGNASAALVDYRASQVLLERLAADDPTNAEWQHDLSITLVRGGDALRAMGDARGALAEYRAGLAIAEKLETDAPSNARWKENAAKARRLVKTCCGPGKRAR